LDRKWSHCVKWIPVTEFDNCPLAKCYWHSSIEDWSLLVWRCQWRNPIQKMVGFAQRMLCSQYQGRTQGGLGLNPLELDILQKLCYKGSVQGLIFYKNKGCVSRRICLLCQKTSLENMNMTSSRDVTNSAYQIKWPPCTTQWNPHENFLRTPLTNTTLQCRNETSIGPDKRCKIKIEQQKQNWQMRFWLLRLNWKETTILKHVMITTEIPEVVTMWSFIGTSLVCNENNTAESCVNVHNCDFFVE